MKININPNPNPVKDADRERFVAEPGFGKYFTDHMVAAEWNQASGWGDANVLAYGPISLDPAAMVFHYGQEIFEGMKAYRQPDRNLLLPLVVVPIVKRHSCRRILLLQCHQALRGHIRWKSKL